MAVRDEDFGGILLLVIVIIILTIFISAENDKLYPNQINDAIDMCKNNGGIRFIETDYTNTSYSLECLNGAEFSRDVIRVDQK